MRRTPWAAGLVVIFGLVLSGGGYAAATNVVQSDIGSAEQIDEARKLFLANCASCHGTNGEGAIGGPSLIRAAANATTKPIAVYPNAGEDWDATTKTWVPAAQDSPSLATSCQEWADLGARLIGGCCRTGPDDIRLARHALLG